VNRGHRAVATVSMTAFALTPASLIAFAIAPAGAAATEGAVVYPAVVNFGTLGRGASSTKTMTIESGATGQRFQVQITGPDAGWYDVGDSGQLTTEVVVPARQRRVVTVRAHIPDDALNGVARAVVRVRPLAAQNPDTTPDTTTDTSRDATIDVATELGIVTELALHTIVDGEQHLAATFTAVDVLSTMAGRPIQIHSTLRNDSTIGVTPTITVTMQRDGIEVARSASHDVHIASGATATITSLLETTAMHAGRYDLTFDASVGDAVLDTRSALVELSAPGFDGALVGIIVNGKPVPGRPIELTATVTNRSGAPAIALVSSRLVRDGRTVATATSTARLIRGAAAEPVKLVLGGATSGRYQLVSTATLNGVAQSSVTTELELRHRHRFPINALAAGVAALFAAGALATVVVRQGRR
jgi:hypothetical protein